MKNHTTDEGWQIFAGLEVHGWKLLGKHLPRSETDVRKIVEVLNPEVVFVQDKREWDVCTGDFRDPQARFINVDVLRERHDIFKLTILKDAQQRPDYHRQSADEIGCHAWVIYYHPDVVLRLAPYLRPQHLIRTYHSVDRDRIPEYASRRSGCLLSGATGGAYPLRTRLFQEANQLPDVRVMKHPGYHKNGCVTPEFLRVLSNHKVAICTASRYGYALRKIIESVACGCMAVTDLPKDEVLPEIDECLFRIDPNISIPTLKQLLLDLYNGYDKHRAAHFAEKAKTFYDYRAVTKRLSEDIEHMRSHYNDGKRVS